MKIFFLCLMIFLIILMLLDPYNKIESEKKHRKRYIIGRQWKSEINFDEIKKIKDTYNNMKQCKFENKEKIKEWKIKNRHKYTGALTITECKSMEGSLSIINDKAEVLSLKDKNNK